MGAGDADVAVGLMATQEGRESLAFTRDSFAALNVVLRTAAEVSDDPLDEATSDHPLRVAVIEGSPLASDLEAFCAQNEIPYETVGFADAGEARDAVLNGRVDVELAADMSCRAIWAARAAWGRPEPEKMGSFWPRTRVFSPSMVEMPVWMNSLG